MLKLYTSYYKKMMNYPKGEDDLFWQVSRTRPFWFVKDGKSLVDENLGDLFGNFADTLEQYWEQLEENHESIADLAEGIKEDMKNLENDPDDATIFFLCYENIEKKPCHRRIIAKYFEEKFGLAIAEWEA
jgi:hypothetical protein